MLQFDQQSSATGNRELIPAGTLVWAILTVKGMKLGRMKDDGTQSRFAECELTIDSGPYERRKVFTNIMDPSHPGNSEGAKRMGYGALARMLEASGLVNPQDPASYARVNGQSFDTLMMWLDGKRVAFKVRTTKGQDGYPPKNEVGDWLSPNPISSSFSDFQKLIAQAGTLQTATAPGFGAAPPAWGNAPAAQQPAPAGQAPGFTQPPTGSPNAGTAAPTAGTQTVSAPAGTTSRSDPANPPAANWLRQAQGQV